MYVLLAKKVGVFSCVAVLSTSSSNYTDISDSLPVTAVLYVAAS
jgi:hypothetical protein